MPLRWHYISSMQKPGRISFTWYATSKKGMWSFSWQTSAIFSHCSGVGSMPVGLCAHPWSNIIDPFGASYVIQAIHIPLSQWELLSTDETCPTRRMCFVLGSDVKSLTHIQNDNFSLKVLLWYQQSCPQSPSQQFWGQNSDTLTMAHRHHWGCSCDFLAKKHKYETCQ